MSRRLPPFAAIRAFEAAARNESFTAAAAELGLTQAAVSYQVKALEERLGAPLFVRERGRARLTPLGQRLLPTLSQAFDSIEAASTSPPSASAQKTARALPVSCFGLCSNTCTPARFCDIPTRSSWCGPSSQCLSFQP